MNLRYIALNLEADELDRMYSSDFTYYTRFISNYFSRAIRKYKKVNDFEFNMICIDATTDRLSECKIKGFNSLSVPVPFDKSHYEKIRGTEDCSYYLVLLEQGFRKASENKRIPLNILLNLIDEFKKGGCKNEWLHKKKRFKEQDIVVRLDCYFTTLDFKLVVTISKISTKEKLCSGTVIRTKPDEVHFDKMFKDVLIHQNFIIITDASDSARVLIDLANAQKGIFNKIFAPYIYSGDYTKEENIKFEKTHDEVVKILSYDGDGFR